MEFLKTPRGDLVARARIGGVRAVEKGFVIQGKSPDELIEFVPTPFSVATAWRDALGDTLIEDRPGRTSGQPDWAALAMSADPQWARLNKFVPANQPDHDA